MVLPIVIGIIIFLIVIFVALKILKNLILGIILIGLVFFASFLILGSFPDLREVPIIGRFLPKFPTTTGEAIAVIRNVIHRIDVLSVSRDGQNNLLITVANTGRLEVSNFNVYVNGQNVSVINNPKDPLKSGETTVIQVDWERDFSQIIVQTNQATAVY